MVYYNTWLINEYNLIVKCIKYSFFGSDILWLFIIILDELAKTIV